MPIEFACVCGKRFKARDDGAGRAFHCPACQADVTVPAPDAVDLGIVTAAPLPPPAPASSGAWKIDGEDLARVIAKGIAIEREERRHRRPWRLGPELMLTLVASCSFFAMANQHPQGATCFVAALAGLLIVGRLRP